MEDKDKLDALIIHAIETNQRLNSIDDNLNTHMKRSQAVEDRMDFLEDEVRPVLENFKGVKWGFRALVAITAVLKFLEYIKH